MPRSGSPGRLGAALLRLLVSVVMCLPHTPILVAGVSLGDSTRHFEPPMLSNPPVPLFRDEPPGGVAYTPVLARTASEARSGSTATCVDYSSVGWYADRDAALQAGAPSADYENRPSTISPCELEQLHQDCVARINMYRDGTLIFKDGTTDSVVDAGIRQLDHMTGNNRCSSAQAMGDLKFNVDNGGGCAGAHRTAFTCPWASSVAQNSCCARGGGAFGDNSAYVTYEGVKERLYDCLKMMWDEGVTPGQKGHWETMRNDAYTQVHCGFAWNTDGRVMMTQDFSKSIPAAAVPCSCDGKNDGDDDGCGGTCADCASGDADVNTDSCAGAAPPDTPPPQLSPTALPTAPPPPPPTGTCTHVEGSNCGRRGTRRWLLPPDAPPVAQATPAPVVPPPVPTPVSTPPPVNENPDGLPQCTAPAARSRGQCESCYLGTQCIDGYCCPYMRKCVETPSTSCSYPIANCNNPRCFDSSCEVGDTCNCPGCANVGEGKAALYDKRWSWLEWANADSSNSGGSIAKTCFDDKSSWPALTPAPTPPPSPCTDSSLAGWECSGGPCTCAQLKGWGYCTDDAVGPACAATCGRTDC